MPTMFGDGAEPVCPSAGAFAAFGRGPSARAPGRVDGFPVVYRYAGPVSFRDVAARHEPVLFLLLSDTMPPALSSTSRPLAFLSRFAI